MTVFCPLPFNNLKIDSFGRVFNCCYQNTPIGNIFKDSISDIFNGVKNLEIRENIKNSNLHSICKESGNCPKIYVKNMHQIKEVRPQHLEIELPNYSCNIGGSTPTPTSACLMCPRSSLDFIPQEEDYTHKILNKIKPVFPFLKSFTVTGLAEPFYKNNIFNVLDYINFAKYKASVSLNVITNATLLNKNMAEKFVKYVSNGNVTFSVDAGNAATYKKIRRFSNFRRVVGNIKDFNKAKLDTISTNLNFNLNALNIKEYKEMLNIASFTGTQVVVFRPTIVSFNKNNLEKISLSLLKKDELNFIETDIVNISNNLKIDVKFVVPLTSVHNE